MKKLILILVFFSFTNLYAGYGKGDLILSDNAVRGFYQYLTNPKGSPGRAKPLRIVVSHDGRYVHWFYCGYSSCVSDGDSELIKICERAQANPCSTFAVRKSVKWKNGVNPGGKDAAFKKSMTLDEVRNKLALLGFVNEGKKKSTNSTYTKKKEKRKNNQKENVVEKLESLNKMYKDGLLTKDEFEDAKKILLN